MDVIFLFLDESVDLGTAWLTGLFVPAEQYVGVRDAVIRITQDTLAAAGHNHLGLVDLHGVDLLRGVPGVTDDHRIHLLEQMVSLVNRERLGVLSIGHLDAKTVRRKFQQNNLDLGEKLYSFNFNQMVDVLDLPADGLVVPVFDGVPGRSTPRHKDKKHDPVDRFAHDSFIEGAQITQWYRVGAEAKPVGLMQYKPNLRNLVEPTFSNGKKSPLLQLSDIVGYLLGALDRFDQEGVRSDWKARVAQAARRIDSKLVHRWQVKMLFPQDQ